MNELLDKTVEGALEKVGKGAGIIIHEEKEHGEVVVFTKRKSTDGQGVVQDRTFSIIILFIGNSLLSTII